jgi:hypothetical protein
LISIPDISGKNRVGETTLAPGEFSLFYMESAVYYWKDGTIWAHGAQVGTRNEEPQGLYFAGRLVYKDDLGVTRQTVFRRRYRHNRNRFYKFEDESEHDYTD